MTRYTILFETGKTGFTSDVAEAVEKLATLAGVSGFSLASAFGLFDGKLSKCYRLEIIATEHAEDNIRTLAEDIRRRYNQDEVWTTVEPIGLIISNRNRSYAVK